MEFRLVFLLFWDQDQFHRIDTVKALNFQSWTQENQLHHSTEFKDSQQTNNFVSLVFNCIFYRSKDRNEAGRLPQKQQMDQKKSSPDAVQVFYLETGSNFSETRQSHKESLESCPELKKIKGRLKQPLSYPSSHLSNHSNGLKYLKKERKKITWIVFE